VSERKRQLGAVRVEERERRPYGAIDASEILLVYVRDASQRVCLLQ
jgi:hypothetical protein